MEKELTLNDYQERAMTTCMPTCENASYMLLNLVGEVGEFASKIAKHIRKGEAGIGSGKRFLRAVRIATLVSFVIALYFLLKNYYSY